MESHSSPPLAVPIGSNASTLRPVACLNCRQRRSYCSKDKPTCSRCRDNGFTCVYEETRKMLVNESYLRDLERKAKAYELLLQSRTLATTDGRPVLDEDEEEFEDGHPLIEPFTQLSMDKPSTSFKGPGSSDNFLLSVRALSGFSGDDGSLDFQPNFYDRDALPLRRGLLPTHIRLPPLDIARRLYAAQYTYIGTIFAFTGSKESFEQMLHHAYFNPPLLSDQDGCLAYAKVLLILAFGQLYSVNQWVNFHGPPGFDYFKSALNFLPDAHEEGSLLCVEALALAGYFMQNMNRRDAAFLYIGMALRMATSLGLHQEVKVSTEGAFDGEEHDSTSDIVRLENRRRTWWSVYSLDRILSVKSGNPMAIQDEDIDVALPSRLPGEAEYCPAVVLRHYTQLSRILGEIHTAIYRKNRDAPKSGKRLMESVQAIVLSLSRWNRALPDELRFDPAKLSISRESVSTFAHYYQCINMTARPLLFHVVKKRLQSIRAGNPNEKERDWREDLSSTTVRVIDMCLGAAQDTINMMTVAAQRDLVATYGFMDGEHIFSSTIVLVMVCVAFPTNPANTAAMNAGLGLLRGLGERGNSHMGARYELLANLRSVLMPGTTAPPEEMRSFLRVNQSQPSMTPMSTVAPSTISMDNTGSNHSESGQFEMLPTNISVDGIQFPAMDTSTLGEPFYDENTSTMMDFGLWEEGFADSNMDVNFDLSRWTSTVGRQDS